ERRERRERRERVEAGGRAGAHEAPPTVLLWPDTFTEHLSPSVGQAALKVLEAAGLRVIVPPTPWARRGPTRPRLPRAPFATGGARLCCGLTYVSTGQLDRARAVLRRTLDLLETPDAPMSDTPGQRPPHEEPGLAPPTPADLPVVVLEPSCAAALRTDLPELLPDDPRAHRLAASVLTFAEVLERHAPHWAPPVIGRPVTGQTHCHQHAVLGDAPDRRLRTAAGLTGDLGGGCCGLAGNFGFEKGHYEVSVACAEDQLLPAVRNATPDTLILADGYSCRTQLEQLAGRRGLHLAEVLARGLDRTDGSHE
ncbi:(Fe-S)-binding protein, partial [Streptomyces scabiei]|nr:(Fe-S)-binding protein [Streptomyces scabiei]